MLAASLEDGSLALFDTVHTIDVRPRRTRMLRYQAMLHMPPPAAAADPWQPWGMLAAPAVSAPPLLPRAWGLLLRLLLQRGLPEAIFRELGSLAASIASIGGMQAQGGAAGTASRTLQVEQALERLETEVGGVVSRWVGMCVCGGGSTWWLGLHAAGGASVGAVENICGWVTVYSDSIGWGLGWADHWRSSAVCGGQCACGSSRKGRRCGAVGANGSRGALR